MSYNAVIYSRNQDGETVKYGINYDIISDIYTANTGFRSVVISPIAPQYTPRRGDVFAGWNWEQSGGAWDMQISFDSQNLDNAVPMGVVEISDSGVTLAPLMTLPSTQPYTITTYQSTRIWASDILNEYVNAAHYWFDTTGLPNIYTSDPANGDYGVAIDDELNEPNTVYRIRRSSDSTSSSSSSANDQAPATGSTTDFTPSDWWTKVMHAQSQPFSALYVAPSPYYGGVADLADDEDDDNGFDDLSEAYLYLYANDQGTNINDDGSLQSDIIPIDITHYDILDYVNDASRNTDSLHNAVLIDTNPNYDPSTTASKYLKMNDLPNQQVLVVKTRKGVKYALLDNNSDPIWPKGVKQVANLNYTKVKIDLNSAVGTDRADEINGGSILDMIRLKSSVNNITDYVNLMQSNDTAKITAFYKLVVKYASTDVIASIDQPIDVQPSNISMVLRLKNSGNSNFNM